MDGEQFDWFGYILGCVAMQIWNFYQVLVKKGSLLIGSHHETAVMATSPKIFREIIPISILVHGSRAATIRSRGCLDTNCLPPPRTRRVCFFQAFDGCLSVRLLAIRIKTTDRISMKILPEIYLWIRKSPLNFRSQLCLDPALKICWGNYYHRGVGREIHHICQSQELVADKLL